jgi:long-chain acyl-CoA synthetase
MKTAGIPDEQGATIIEALASNAFRRPSSPAMRYRNAEGEWQVISWSDYLAAVRQVAGGLAALGIAPGSRVAVLSANRPEWHIADLGILATGCISVPIYPTSSTTQIAYVLRHAKVEACIVDSHTQAGKVLEVRDQAPTLRHVVVVDQATRSTDTFLRTFDELSALGADLSEADRAVVEQRMRDVHPDDVATLVYTSGTTGPPKATMITHHNIMWTLRQVAPVYSLTEGDRMLSFLPLSHIAERMMSEFTPIGVGGETWFARGLATVAQDLPECRPTIFLAVPRVWEKLREGIEGHIRRQPMAVRVAVERYMQLGSRKVQAEQAGLSPSRALAATYESLNRTVGASIRRQIGLDKARFVVSAAAPIHPDLVRWYYSIGLPMYQIYGQTEGCGPSTANRPGRVRIGTVGEALPGMTVKLAEDGEVLLKGDNVCLGYLDDPAATAELIDTDGWMHTGDTGEFDQDGQLRIVGRKKDLIVTAAGKNIAPQDIEVDLANHPLVSEAVVVGEGRKYLAALLTLDVEELTRWARMHDKLDDPEALTEDPDLMAEIDKAIEAVNRARSHAEGIRKFRILPHDLTAASGELTPTMKVKRNIVYQNYAEVIDELYAAA